MGTGLAANLLASGFTVAAWDRDIAVATDDGNADTAGINICQSLSDLVSAIEKPRRILMSIRSGPPVDQVLEQLRPLLSPGDVIADCGNSHFQDTARRATSCNAAGLGYLGVGVSGGPDGARTGPAIMAGGDEASWQCLGPVFDAVAAKVDGSPCSGYVGPGGAGHFVKMVHNGIEYAIMHLLMEAYAFLRRSCGDDRDSLIETMAAMNSGLTASYLTEITATVIAKRLPAGDAFLVDIVAGAAGHKGTGMWSVMAALEQGVAVPTISEAVMYRLLSAQDDGNAISVQSAPPKDDRRITDPTRMSDALTCAFISSFAQGLSIFDTCVPPLEHALDRKEILRIWRGGCILQGKMVEFLWQNAADQATSDNILNWPLVRDQVTKTRGALRSVVAASTLDGVPSAGLSSALAYAETKIGTPLPTAVLQLQRDYFGRHGVKDKRTGKSISISWGRDDDTP